MRVLITGGAGFIGSNLVRRLRDVDPGGSITVLDDLSTGRATNLDGVDVRFVVGAVQNPAAVRDAVAGVESIVHLGALGSVPRSIADPLTSHHANATGTLTLLEGARAAGVEHVIVASSSSVYGGNPKLPKSESDWTRPLSPYSVTKQATESYALAYRTSFGLRTLAFRFFNVYGPRQPADHVYAAVIPRFLDAAFAGQPLRVHGDGLQSRDFTYVGTVCAVLIDALRHGVDSDAPVNLAYGTNTTLLDLIALIEERVGRPLELAFDPARPGDVRASQADGVSIRKLFPAVVPTSLDAGLTETVDWFRQNAR